MKIITTIKRVTDYEARLKILPDNSFIDLTDINMITNPFDEIGVEAALQIKKKVGGEIIAVSIGDNNNQQNLRSALAMGADKGILVNNFPREQFVNTKFTSEILYKICQDEKPDLIIMGKQSIDTDNHQISEYLSEKMGIGNASQANKITIEESYAIVKKESDGGLETIKLKLPCIITVDLRLNQPRYPSLPGIMKAKRKPIKMLDVSDFCNKENSLDVKIINVREQEKRKAGIILNNVDELLTHIKLKKENL